MLIYLVDKTLWQLDIVFFNVVCKKICPAIISVFVNSETRRNFFSCHTVDSSFRTRRKMFKRSEILNNFSLIIIDVLDDAVLDTAIIMSSQFHFTKKSYAIQISQLLSQRFSNFLCLYIRIQQIIHHLQVYNTSHRQEL